MTFLNLIPLIEQYFKDNNLPHLSDQAYDFYKKVFSGLTTLTLDEVVARIIADREKKSPNTPLPGGQGRLHKFIWFWGM